MTACVETAQQASAPPNATLRNQVTVRRQATVRSQVTVPLRFPDGFSTTAVLLTFRGLADGTEHLLPALGQWEQQLLAHDVPLVRLHSECMTGDVFGSLRPAGHRPRHLRRNLALGHGEDERDYTAAAQMLDALDATSNRLLSYLAAKRDRTAHTLELSRADVGPVPQVPAGTVPSHDEMLSRVDDLVPLLRELAEETEQLRRLPDSTMQELKEAGVFRILAPKSVGGYGMGVETYA